MQNKRWVWAVLLVIGFLYRVRLFDIQVWQMESIKAKREAIRLSQVCDNPSCPMSGVAGYWTAQKQ